jgi:hypothetical protein
MERTEPGDAENERQRLLVRAVLLRSIALRHSWRSSLIFIVSHESIHAGAQTGPRLTVLLIWSLTCVPPVYSAADFFDGHNGVICPVHHVRRQRRQWLIWFCSSHKKRLTSRFRERG